MKVFLFETIHPKAYAALAAKAEIVNNWEEAAEADAVIDRQFRLGAAEMDRLPNLKVIAVHGTGTSDVDLEEARRRGIRVVYAPHLNANAVAELGIALLLEAYRKIALAQKLLGQGIRPEDMQLLSGRELKGKTLGLVGTGAIASRMGQIASAGFGMKVLAYSRSFTDEKAKLLGFERAESLTQVLCEADAVSLNLPLTPQTEGLIGEKELRMMKKEAVLINTSRGPLIKEEDLYNALQNGVISAAACDVLCHEPVRKQEPLLRLPNFIATPHMGANTDEALYTVGMACVDQIFDVLEGRQPRYPVV